MKRKLLYSLVALTLVVGLTGCGKTEKKKEQKSNDLKAAFTIECTDEKDDSFGFETQNVITYYFNKEQYVTDYCVTTTQKFDDEEIYEEYKAAQEETVKNTSSDIVTYDLKYDDKTKTLVFTVAIKNIDVNEAETEEEKAGLKASAILKSNEELKYTCTIEGIDKSELK